jgi:hypothetical protein
LDDIFVFLITTPVVAHSLPFPKRRLAMKKIRGVDNDNDSGSSGRAGLR